MPWLRPNYRFRLSLSCFLTGSRECKIRAGLPPSLTACLPSSALDQGSTSHTQPRWPQCKRNDMREHRGIRSPSISSHAVVYQVQDASHIITIREDGITSRFSPKNREIKGHLSHQPGTSLDDAPAFCRWNNAHLSASHHQCRQPYGLVSQEKEKKHSADEPEWGLAGPRGLLTSADVPTGTQDDVPGRTGERARTSNRCRISVRCAR